MSKEDKTVTNQYAFIWNYNAHVDHQHNYMGGKPEREKAETDADKEERILLLATNTIIRTQTQSGQQTVDLLKLYRFVDKYFVSEITYKYEWYALRRYLEKYRLLMDCDNEQFAGQMNKEEWFAHSLKSCEANEINIYNFLNDIQPELWCNTDIPLGSRATKHSVRILYKTYSNLEIYKDQLIG